MVSLFTCTFLYREHSLQILVNFEPVGDRSLVGRLAGTPDTFRLIPRTLGDTLRTLGDTLRTLGDTARTLGDLPRTFVERPRTLGDNPRLFSVFSWTAGDLDLSLTPVGTLNKMNKKEIINSITMWERVNFQMCIFPSDNFPKVRLGPLRRLNGKPSAVARICHGGRALQDLGSWLLENCSVRSCHLGKYPWEVVAWEKIL